MDKQADRAKRRALLPVKTDLCPRDWKFYDEFEGAKRRAAPADYQWFGAKHSRKENRWISLEVVAQDTTVQPVPWTGRTNTMYPLPARVLNPAAKPLNFERAFRLVQTSDSRRNGK
jgi:hypothetical protein